MPTVASVRKCDSKTSSSNKPWQQRDDGMPASSVAALLFSWKVPPMWCPDCEHMIQRRPPGSACQFCGSTSPKAVGRDGIIEPGEAAAIASAASPSPNGRKHPTRPRLLPPGHLGVRARRRKTKKRAK